MSFVVNPYWYKYPCTDYDVLLFLKVTGITDQTIASALCALVAGMKANGTWAKCNAIYPFVGATATTHKYNLKNPVDSNAAFRLTFSGGWTHSQSGALPNGTNAYANTFYQPTFLNTAHLSFYSRTNTTGLFNDIGSGGAPIIPNSVILTRYLDRFYGNNNQNLDSFVTNTDSRGFYLTTRTSATDNRLYKNLALVLTSGVASTSIAPFNIYISAFNQGGITTRFSNRECAFASIGTGLTDIEATSLSSLVQQFQISLGRQISFPYVSDTDAQAFVNAANITSVTQANAVNTLVIDLKNAGVWTKLNAIYPMVGGTAFAHKFNLKDPRDLDVAFRLLFVNTWTHSANGALPNGTNAYANTYLTPSVTLLINSTSLSYYSRTDNSISERYDMGAYNTPVGRTLGFLINFNNFFYSAVNDGAYNQVATTGSAGFYLSSRTASNIKRGFKNGVLLQNTTTLSTGLPTIPIYLAQTNSNVTGYGNKQCAFASIGTGLSDSEVALFNTAVQTFQTTLGRSIGTQTVSDSDAQAFINAAALIDQVQTTAINNLVLNLKANGLWTRMSAIYPMVGETATTQKWNLKDPRDLNVAFRLSFLGGGWTHSANGALPNGTTSYADTYLVPNTNLSLNNHSFGIYSRTNNTAGNQIYGSFDNIVSIQHNIVFPGSTQGGFSSGNSGITYPINTTSFLAASRTSSTEFKGYRAGVSLGSTSTAMTSLPTVNFLLSARLDFSAGTAIKWFNRQELAFAFLGGGVNDAESVSLYNIVQTYQMQLGRFIGFPVTLDQDANIFITAAGITDLTQISAINTLVTNLKIAQLWPKMKAIYPMVGGTALAHKFNLKNPVDTNAAYRLLFSGGWTHSATGALPNGTNAYAETYLPVNSLTQNSTHNSYYSRSNTTSPVAGSKFQYEIGANYLAISPPYYFGLTLLRLGITSGLINQRTFTTTTSIADTRGYYVGNRISSAQFTMFKNAQLVLTSLDASASPALSPLTIWLAANNGQPGNWSDRECAFATIGDGLTDEEQSNLYTIIQYFQITLNRQV